MTPEQIEYLKNLAPVPEHWGGLGATPLPLDPRDYDIRRLPGVAAMLATGVPDAVDLTGFVRGEILNQGATGACVAFSTAHLCAVDDVIEGQAWPNINAPLMYSRAGGTGQNGVDSRLVLQQAVESGVPLSAGGSFKIVRTYAFVPQDPASFTPVLKAALAAGYPCVLALLLPTDFGWRSGHGAVSQGYHQICLLGYTADGYWIFVNSWGASWPGNSPHAGVGSVLQNYITANDLQQRYAFSYTVTPLDAGPPPPPPPVQLTVSGYQPNPVKSGAGLAVSGSGFDMATKLTWQGVDLPVIASSASAITTVAPKVTSSQSARVVATNAKGSAAGPLLTVQADAPPPPPPVKGASVIGRATGTALEQLQTGIPYPLGAGDRTVAFSSITLDGGPEPPAPLRVTGYSPNGVMPGASFQILGSGFAAGGNLSVTWGGVPLTASRMSDAAIQATAPMGVSAANIVTVRIEGLSADGPLLQIGDGGPPPIQGIKVLLTTKPSQLRNTVSVIAYTTDQSGGSLPASVNGQVVGSQGSVDLPGLSTHGTSGPAIWKVQRPCPWNEPCQVTVNAFGNGLTGSETKPG